MYYLIDCNQFYVSCEQLFNPKLHNRPIVVLTNNDGCVVARSKQAKALGIPMGAPAYQCAETFQKHNVHVLSSNYTLYGDMSRRVMSVLSLFSPEMEEYSIDEAFLHINTPDPLSQAQEIRRTVLQWTGIPVSIGIGATKTLAKVASDLAKNTGVFFFSNEEIDAVLKKLPVTEIWGIGKRLGASLEKEGIRSAWAFKEAEDGWIQKRFSTVLLRTAYELRGIPCLKMEEEPAPRKSITCSRSFGKTVKTLAELEEALSSYVSSAAKKLRQEKLLPSFLTVFAMTSPFAPRTYSNSATITLNEPSDFSPELLSLAKKALRKIFCTGYEYKKTGITFGGLVPRTNFQPDLFCHNAEEKKKKQRAMHVMDSLNGQFKTPVLKFAAEGIAQKWQVKRGNLSQKFTTCWDELLTIEMH